jgi:hypothetical protein
MRLAGRHREVEALLPDRATGAHEQRAADLRAGGVAAGQSAARS